MRQILTNFTAGEVTPKLDGRVDVSKYFNSVKTLFNMIVYPYGPVTRRAGTKFVYPTRNGASRSRDIPFRFDTNYIMEFGDKYIRFFEAGGVPITTPGPIGFGMYSIFSCYPLTDGITGWQDYSDSSPTHARIAFVSPNLCLFSDNAASFARAVRVLTIPNAGTYALGVWNSDATPVFAKIGSTLHGDDVLASKTINFGVANSFNFNTASIAVDKRRTGYLELYGNNTGTVGLSNIFITRNSIPCYEIETTINEASLPYLKYAQREDTMFLVSGQGDMPPAELIRYDHTDWTFGNITFDCDPFNGATTVGYPRCCSFFEQRSLWANTPGNQQGIWASVTGVYRSLETGINDDDGFSFTLDSEDFCPIYFIASTKQLIIGTGGGMFKVSSDAYTEPITPTNIFARRAERTAAADMLPCIVGVSVLFMEEHNRMLGEAKYDAAADGITVTDMAILSEHLLNENMNGSTIVEVAYQKTPDNILWGRQENGNLLGFTFNPKQEITGWHRHETQGSVESIAVTPGKSYDELWMIVKRTINNVATRVHEVMQSPEFKNIKDAWFLDCAVLRNGPTAATTITGLDHLNGASVAILADGAVVPMKTVSGGSIVLTTAATKVLVGLPMTSRIQTMRAEIQTQTGTAQGRLKRIFRVVARVFKTASFKAGYDFDHMDTVTLRTTADPMDAPVPLVTGDVEILPFRGDWDKEGHICIEQSDPVPLTISAVIADLDIDG